MYRVLPWIPPPLGGVGRAPRSDPVCRLCPQDPRSQPVSPVSSIDPCPPFPIPPSLEPFPGAPQLFPFSHSRLHSVPESPFPRARAQVPLFPLPPLKMARPDTTPNPKKPHLRMKISVSSIDPCPPFRARRQSEGGDHFSTKKVVPFLHLRTTPSRLVQDNGSRKLPQTKSCKCTIILSQRAADAMFF